MENFDDSKDSIHEESTEVFFFEKDKKSSPEKVEFTTLLSAEPEQNYLPRDDFVLNPNINIDEVELKSREAKRKIFQEYSSKAAEFLSR